jgi:asparagine synthase (glutamine-hydrolysing)
MSGIKFSFGERWVTVGNTHVRGSAFIDDNLLDSQTLAGVYDSASPQERIKLLSDINGFFAVVCITDTILFAATDRVRTIPFFYAIHDKQIFISDDAYWVATEIGDKETNSMARLEFLLSGYVTGEDTLCPNVKQIQAGEVIYNHNSKTEIPVISSQRYFRYIHHDYVQDDAEALKDRFQSMIMDVGKRLIKYSNGRTIVVPLSGGYDSRLIVLVLKQLKYDNLIAFSYGKLNNEESLISKEIAESLNVKWLFVPYTKEKGFEWYHSHEAVLYRQTSSNSSAISYFQDWPALKTLFEKRLIPSDSVFVPGLSGDLPSGGFRVRYLQFVQHKELR